MAEAMMSSAQAGEWEALAELSRQHLVLLQRCAHAPVGPAPALGGRELEAALGETTALLELVRSRRQEVIASLKRKRQANKVKTAYGLDAKTRRGGLFAP